MIFCACLGVNYNIKYFWANIEHLNSHAFLSHATYAESSPYTPWPSFFTQIKTRSLYRTQLLRWRAASEQHKTTVITTHLRSTKTLTSAENICPLPLLTTQ